MDPRAPTDQGVSEREAEVLALVGEHLTNAEIAARLFISVRTVESHVSSLLRKLDAPDRRALAARASRASHGDRDGNGGSAAPAVTAVTAATATDVRPGPPLPAPLTSFVGRRAERAALADALVEHRLVSAVGPGGVGKTRLALAVAADVGNRYAQGCWYVDLVPVTDPAMIGAAVAEVLGFAEQFRRSPTETVVERLADAEALLVLDNCEHLIDGVAGLAERLLGGCPGVTVLVTSQARLGLPFEWAFTVPGLSLTDDAVALFLERAAMVGWSPGSDDDRRRIATICDDLDGSALAIELAAARLATRGLDSLEAALGNRLRLLTGGPRLDERHQSLRSALDWSHELLSPADQAVLRQVSVFAAPFTAEAAAALTVEPAPLGEVDVAESLAYLANQSLLVVRVGADGVTRYRLLETIRQYAAEVLVAQGEDRAVRERHLQWCQATASALVAEAAEVAGLDPGEAFEAAFAAVADELRAALLWATAAARAADAAERRAPAHDLAVSLAQLTTTRGMASEAQRRYEQAALLAADDTAAVGLLRTAADVALSRLAGDDALRLLRTAAETARRAGDPRAAALALSRAAELLDRSPGLMSEVVDPTSALGLLDEARELAGDDAYVEAAILTVLAGSEACAPRPSSGDDAERALAVAERMGDTRLESAALDQMSVHQLGRGDVLAAAATSVRRTELLAPVAHRPDLAFEYSDALHMASLSCIGAGDLPAALRYAQQRYDLPFHREDAHLGINWLLVGRALAGDLDEGMALAAEFLAGWQRAGRPALGAFAVSADGAALIEGLRGDDDALREWRGVAVEMRRNKRPDFPNVYVQIFDAILSLHRGAPADALAILADDPETLDHWHTGAWRHWYAALRTEAAVLAGTSGPGDDPAKQLARTREMVAGNPIATAIVDRTDAVACGDLDRLPALAANLAPLSRYQQARTLVLAGGTPAAQGQSLLTTLHATPMALPTP